MTDNLRPKIRKWTHFAIGVAVLLYGIVGFSGSGTNEAHAQETTRERVPPYEETYEVEVPYQETYTVQVPYTYTVQVPYTYTVQESYTYTVQVQYTYTVAVTYTYTVQVPYTYTVQVQYTYTEMVPVTSTIQVPYTYTVQVAYTYTEMVPVTSTIQVPYTYTVQVPYTVTLTRSVPPCHPMWGCTQETYTVTLYRSEQRTGYRAQEVTSYRPVQRTGYRPEERTGTRPQEVTSYRPVQRTGYRPEQRTGSRPEQRTSCCRNEQRTGYRPEQRTGTRPVQRTGSRSEERTGTRAEQRTRTAYRTETRTREVFNFVEVPVENDQETETQDPACPHGGVYPDCNPEPDGEAAWQISWAERQRRMLLNDPEVEEEDLPDNPDSPSFKEDLEELIAAIGDEPGFTGENAQAILDTLLLDGQVIDRETMAAVLCAGLDNCHATDSDGQIDHLAENGITAGRHGVCVTNPGSPECREDYDRESDMTNAQLVTFVSRLLGCEDCGDPQEQTIVNTDPQVCPSGWTGTYPNCVPPQTCPAGWTGTYPNCVAPVVNPPQTCPDGWTGSPPNCVAPPQVCPDGWTGTYPNCVAPAQPPVVSFFSSSLNVNEGSSVTIYAVLDEVATTPSSVRFDLSGAINGNGSCSAGADFYTSASAFTFNNSISASVSLTACDDSDSTDEAVTLSLTNSGIVDLQLGSPSTATVTINDDDATPVVVSYGQASYTVDEGSTVTVSVQLDTAPGRTVTIPISTFHQGGASTSDYSGVPSSVTFQSGDTQKSFVFTATQDQEDDDNESVGLSFGTLPTSVSEGSPRTASIPIRDDDQSGNDDGYGL